MAEQIEKAIAVLGGRQHGYVTRGQLLRLGLGRRAIEYRVQAGRLMPVHAGVYAVGHVNGTPVARAAAAVLACGDGAVLSHGSAASLWGLDKHWTMPFEVIAKSRRIRPGIKFHRSTTLARRDRTRQFGVRVTTPARTILDNAPRLNDKRLTRWVNDARHMRILSLDGLADVLTRNPRHPGTARLLPFVTNYRGLTRSELEDTFIAFADRYGLAGFETNVPLNGYVADVLFLSERLIVEVDSVEFHLDRATFESDRNRDADQLAAGFQTVRVTEQRLKGQDAQEAARLHTILAACRRAAA